MDAEEIKKTLKRSLRGFKKEANTLPGHLQSVSLVKVAIVIYGAPTAELTCAIITGVNTWCGDTQQQR